MKKIIILLSCCLLLAGCTGKKNDDYIEQTNEQSNIQVENDSNLYDANGTTSITIGEVQFQIPSSWNKDVKKKDDFTYYYYDDLMFLTQYTTAKFSNAELISEANEFVDGLKSGYDECVEDKISITNISDIKAIEFSANVKLKNKKGNIKVISFIFNQKLYNFSLFVEEDAKIDYVKEYESFKESIIITPSKSLTAPTESESEESSTDVIFEKFKQNIIDSTKNLGNTDIEKQIYYNDLIESLPYVKKLTVYTWKDSNEFDKFLLSIGYFYTHYEDGTKGHEIGRLGFLVAEALMNKGTADVEATVLSIENLLLDTEDSSLSDSDKSMESIDGNKDREPIQLATGRYIVGEDIPAGKYNIEGIKKGNVHVCSKGKDYGDIVNEIITPGETTYANVRLEDGYTVEVVLGGKIQLVPK